MYRSGETSCSISAIGNKGASASGPTGSRVPGCSGGGGGEGRSGTTLYHCRGSCDSCRTYLTWLSMDASGGQGGNVINATLVHLPAPGYIRLLAEAAAAENERAAAGKSPSEAARELLLAANRDVVSEQGWAQLLVEFRVHAARDPVLNRRYAEAHGRTVAHLAALVAGLHDRAGTSPAVPPQ